MNGMKKAAAVVIVGLAAATAVTGTAAAAEKGAPSSTATKAVAQGSASSSTLAKAPAAQKSTVTRQKAATGGASTAAAATRSCYVYSNGTGDFCQWWLVNYTGSRGGVFSNDSNLSDNYFATAGGGQYSTMRNNAESDYNYDRYYTAKVATSINYYGYVGIVSPRTGGNYNSTYKNNVESLYWT